MRKLFYISVLFSSALPALAQPNVPQPPREPNAALLKTVTWPEVEKQIGGLTLVSLNAQNMMAQQALQAVAQQAVPPLRVSLDSLQHVPAEQRPAIIEPTLTAQYTKLPFWSAMHNAMQTFHTRIEKYESTSSALYFSPVGMAQTVLAQDSGPCLFTLNEARYGRYLNQLVPGARDGRTTGGAALAGETLALNGSLYIDPKMRWHPSNLIVHLQEARDDKNQSLLPAQDIKRYSNLFFQSLVLNLKPSQQRSQSLKSLRGTLHGVVAMDNEQWEFEDVMNGKKSSKNFGAGEGEVRVELEPIVDTGAGYRVNLTVSQSEESRARVSRLSTGETIRLGGGDNVTLRLLDKKGREIESLGLTRQEGGEMIRERFYTYRIFGEFGSRHVINTDPDSKPAKLVLSHTSDYRELIVPFEFKDIPLP